MIHDRNASGVQELLAANLRRLRIARHLSLSELARTTGISKATLSGIENGRGNPTIDTLADVASALRIAVPELLGEVAPEEVRVVRASDSALVVGDVASRRTIDEVETTGRVGVSEIAFAALETHEPDPGPSGARIGVYVLEGKLIAGPVERATELSPGDYMAFPADVPYAFAAARKRARALLLMHIPG
jgi:transcriptional regulator with XRE-family HTH domain